MLTSEQQQKAIGELLQKRENSFCADCSGKSPCWASLDFGVFVCMNCAGAHRALGPSTTRVKSTKLDTWNRDWLQNMRMGNSVLNQYWQSQLFGDRLTQKPNVNTSLEEIIRFVQEKYVNKAFADRNQKMDPLKRSKQPQYNRSQSVQTKQNSNPATVVKEKAPIKSNIECPFSAFDNIILSKPKQQKKPKLPDNLISFDTQATKQKYTQVNAAQKPQTQKVKHDLNQFYSVSGTGSKSKPQKDLFLSFDNLVRQNSLPQEKIAVKNSFQSNSFLNSNINLNQNAQSTFSSIQTSSTKQNIPTYDRAQYGTMNMNTHSTAKNNNMNSFMTNGFSEKFTPITTNINYNSQFLGQFGAKPPLKPPPSDAKITLDSNISFGAGGVKKQKPKSWVDEWK